MGGASTGDQIRHYRKARGMTQKELGSKCGMADSAIRKYESGKVTPKWETIKRLAAALDIDPLLLIGFGDLDEIDRIFEDEANKTAAAAKRLLPDDPSFLLECVLLLGKLNSEGRKAAIQVIEKLASNQEYLTNYQKLSENADDLLIDLIGNPPNDEQCESSSELSGESDSHSSSPIT